ncbi:hypothetical protein LINPERHAP1_LOCUS3195 [Linum perenne]
MRSTGTWNALWNCKVPPRIKVMLWRLARGILPTRSALYRRGIQIDDVCGVCNTMFETQWHLFVECSFARECWDRVGLREETTRIRDSADSFKDWILTAISSLSTQKIQGSLCSKGFCLDFDVSCAFEAGCSSLLCAVA